MTTSEQDDLANAMNQLAAEGKVEISIVDGMESYRLTEKGMDAAGKLVRELGSEEATTKPTIDLAALAADLEALGWTVNHVRNQQSRRSHYDHRRIDVWEDGQIEVWSCDPDDPYHESELWMIDITDPIWAKALPILLRHVAGKGGV